MPTTSPPRPVRRPELDLIRTLVVMGLIFFHTSLIFDERDDYYVKNDATSTLPTVAAGFAVVWAMPALFLISGIGSLSSLQARGTGGFVRERLLRLGIPLIVATITIVPVPAWLRERANGDVDTSYWEFLPKFFTVHLDLRDFPFLLGGDYFETGHLWFVVLLITYSLALAVVWAVVPAQRLRGFVSRLRAGLASLVLAAVPLALITAFVGMEEDFAGWSRWAYLVFFLYGVVIASGDRFREEMRRAAPIAAFVGLALFGAGAPVFIGADGDPFTDMDPVTIAARAAFGAAGWFWVVAIVGFLDRWYSRAAVNPDEERHGGRVLRHLTIASLPVYVLHQPILVAVAYPVVAWDISGIAKFVVITTVTFAVTLGIYELLVARTSWGGFLFGARRRVEHVADPA